MYLPAARPSVTYNPVVTLSGAGVVFILMGFFALAVPASQEGAIVWQSNGQFVLYVMDVAGAFTISLGMLLTCLGSMVWNRQVH